MTTRSAELLRVAHTTPGVTRAAAARLLGIGTGATTELVARLAQAHLLAEAPAAPSGARGRPTTVLVPHPEGPLVLAAEITHESWRIDVVELGGTTLTSRSAHHEDPSWPAVAAAINAAITELQKAYPSRVRAMGVSVPGTVSRTLHLDAANLGWHDVDLTALRPALIDALASSTSRRAAAGPLTPSTPGLSGGVRARTSGAPEAPGSSSAIGARTSGAPQAPGSSSAIGARSSGAPQAPGSSRTIGTRVSGAPHATDGGVTSAPHSAGRTPLVFVAGNDASLAAAAESARGAAAGAQVALHLRIEGGLGGAVVDHGHLMIGAQGASGEFGHMPFGDPAITCPCGAQGCWGTAVDGTALARHLGHPPPRDPVTYARRIIASATRPEPVEQEARVGEVRAERDAVRVVAAALGRGIAGLVNALDADLVTLGGVGPDLLAAAEEEIQTSYRAGLMAIRRDDPPPIRPAALGSDGPIAGAAEEAWASLIPHLA
ncbi:ROK family protein [Actinoplanes sp. NPDC049596]|uniref:ROK family protein n=1 Tax=unclassified Actinoplanes TaxID=2626549 RepID=UPI003417E994